MHRKKYYVSESGGLVALYVLLIVAAFTIQQIIAHSVSESRATNAAEDLGYTDIKVVARDTWFVGLRGCGNDDAVRFTVEGTNPNGEKRTFYVCAGYFKGGTVRSK